MKCLACRAPNISVIETRHLTDDTTRRLRKCGCGARWYTTERPDRDTLTTPPPPANGDSAPIDMTYGPPSNGESKPISGPGKPSNGVRVSGSSSDLDLFSGQGSDQISSQLTKQNNNTMGGRGALYMGVLGQFCRAWQGRYGKPYRPTGADRNQLGRMLHDLLPEDLPDLAFAFANYLADLSPYVAQSHRHGLTLFCTSGGFNKYRTVAPILSKREASSVAAGEQWLAMQEGGHGKNGSK